jgi:hypothetical protein
MTSDDEIPGVGRPGERLRHNPAIKIERLPLSSEDYFVWTRVDGQTAIREVILMSGFARDKAIAILRRLRGMGALLREGETQISVAAVAAAPAERRRPAMTPSRGTPTSAAAPVAPRAAAAITAAAPPATAAARPAPAAAARPAPAAAARPAAAPTAGAASALPDPSTLTAEERAALAEDVALSQEQRLRVIAMRRKLDGADHFAMLEVDASTDKRELRRAFFTLSKEFHPDRFFGKRTGSFGPWLAKIFARLKEAHEVLSDDKKRQEYEQSLTGQRQVSSQTKTEYAAELFERACSVQTSGELPWALQLFAAAIRLDPQARYLGRAARCAIDAGATGLAVTYARQAVETEPENPSMHRVLAAAQEAVGDLAAAQATLEAALALKSENDVLTTGLRADLERVRARLGSNPGP